MCGTIQVATAINVLESNIVLIFVFTSSVPFKQADNIANFVRSLFKYMYIALKGDLLVSEAFMFN